MGGWEIEYMFHLLCILYFPIILCLFHPPLGIINRISRFYFLIAGSTGFGFLPRIIEVRKGEVTSLSLSFL